MYSDIAWRRELSVERRTAQRCAALGNGSATGHGLNAPIHGHFANAGVAEVGDEEVSSSV
jgi:hypothetical protein